MRATMLITLMLVTSMAAARPAAADDTAALEAAKRWHAGMLDSGVRLAKAAPAAPDAELAGPSPPVVMAVFDRWKACRWFASAKLKRFQSTGQLARCLAVLDRNGRYPVSTAVSFAVVELDEAVATVAARYKRSLRARVLSQLKRDAKGATIVRALAGSAAFVMTYMVIGADRTIKAVWVVEDVAEMVPDSPSQTR